MGFMVCVSHQDAVVHVSTVGTIRTDVVEELIFSGSYLLIFLVIVGTGAGLPIPEEVPIVAAGLMSAPQMARMDPGIAFGVCLVAALMGDIVMFSIGRGLGASRLRESPWFAHLLNEKREQQMGRMMDEHGLKILMVARFLVGVRAPMYIAAGISGLSFRRFIAADGFCATLVVGLFFWSSYYFGGWVGPLIRESQVAATIVIVGLLVCGGLYLLVYKRFRRKMDEVETSETSIVDSAEPRGSIKVASESSATRRAIVAPPGTIAD